LSDEFRECPITCETRCVDEDYCPDINPGHTIRNGFVEINLVVSGSGIHQIMNEADEFCPGDIHIIGGGVSHSYYAIGCEDKPVIYTLSFEPSAFLDHSLWDIESERYCLGVFRDTFPISASVLNTTMTEEFKNLFKEISDEISEKPPEWQTVVGANLTILLAKLGRYMDMADTVKVEYAKTRMTVFNAKRLIEENCHDNAMTLVSLASSLYVSPSYLSRIFAKATGETFSNYVRNIRIERACKLLKTTNLTNREIVNQCGLKDIPSFYRIFKALMGMTPYQYKMSQKIYQGESVMSILVEISENLQKGKAKIVKELVQSSLDNGLPAVQILNDGLLSGMSVIGEKFKNGEVYVPEVLVAARAMNQGMELLKPFLVEDGVQSKGKVCIGTVQGDLHDIGKNIVKMMMEGKGLEVIDLGVDVAPESFVQAAIENECAVICCSALLTTTMGVMAEVVKASETAGIRDKVKIMVGGAPVTDGFCREIGADTYTPDAASAADAAVEHCSSL